jgi:hypothetical protein
MNVVIDEYAYQINRDSTYSIASVNTTKGTEGTEGTKGIQTSFVSNYKSKKMCKAIVAITDSAKGYITDDAGSLLCYRKEIKDKKTEKTVKDKT